MSEREVYKPQGKGDKTSDWGDWGSQKKKGRPHKVDEYGQKIYRASTSIYIDVRLKEWITAKAGNLSDWIEKMIRSAYQKEYCTVGSAVTKSIEERPETVPLQSF